MRWRYFFSSPHHCGEGDCRRRRSEGEESASDFRGGEVAESSAWLGTCPVCLIATLFRHVGDGGDHGGDARKAGSETHVFSSGHLSGELRGYDDLTAGLYLGATADLADHAVHIYNVNTTLAGILREAAGCVEIVVDAFPTLIADRIGIHHGTVDLHRRCVRRYEQTVAGTQHDVGIALRIFQSFVQFDADRIGVGHLELLELLLQCLV